MNTTTVVGNLTADPDLRYTASGKPVAHFTIASTPRHFDRESGTWLDGDTVFVRCNAWGPTAENTTEALAKGTRVVATGQLIQRTFEDKDGSARTVVELDVDEIGATLRFGATRSTGEPATASASA